VYDPRELTFEHGTLTWRSRLTSYRRVLLNDMWRPRLRGIAAGIRARAVCVANTFRKLAHKKAFTVLTDERNALLFPTASTPPSSRTCRGRGSWPTRIRSWAAAASRLCGWLKIIAIRWC
jgi:hypothetical protein